MDVDNRTPFLHVASVTSRHPPRLDMVFVVRGKFRIEPGGVATVAVNAEGTPLAQGYISAETYHDDDEEQTGECLGPNDLADYKLNAEVMLRGTCHPPGGKATECSVRFGVGAWSKTLEVTGRRVWSDEHTGAAISDPIPFETMELSYRNAFGGQGHEPNPCGKGLGTKELPTVEHASARVRTTSDRPLPAGFGPLSPTWPQRTGFQGKEYGEDYQKHRAPWYAVDFDWRYFHCAPADQQLQGYLRGDEDVRFTHMFAGERTVKTKLPGIRLRVFYHTKGGPIREVPMVIDTLYALPDEEAIYLTWRGLAPVSEDDLMDVQTVLVDQELLVDAPLPEAHYHQLLRDFEADPLGMEAAKAEFAEMQAEGEAAIARLEAVAEDMKTGNIDDANPIGDVVTKLFPDNEELKKQTAAGAEMTKARGNAGKPPPDFKAAMQKAVAAPPPGPPALVLPKVGAKPKPQLPGDVVAQLKDAVAKVNEAADMAAEGGAEVKLKEILEEHEMFQELLATPEPKEPGPNLDLRGQDYTNRDLRGCDLSGSDLTGALFSNSNLRGAQLQRAQLHGAVFYQADLEDADLSDTKLEVTNFSEAKAHRTKLAGATINRTLFTKADFTGADLTGAQGVFGVFMETILVGARLSKANFFQTIFQQANLAQSVWSNAEITRCLLLDCDLTQAAFDEALLSKSCFIMSNLHGARFVEARGEHVGFIKAKIANANFTRCIFPGIQMMEAEAVDSTFFGANLKEGKFYRGVFDRSRFEHANLFKCDLRKTQLTDVSFKNASLFAATLTDAAGRGCDFTGANMKRCIVNQERQ